MSAPAPSATQQPTRGVRQTDKSVAVPVAVGVVVATIVTALALVGLVVAFDSDELPTGPAMAPPPAPTAEVSYDSVLRMARYEDVLVTMPGKPYECPGSPEPMSPVLSSGLICNATIHPKYDGSSDWAASAAFGSVPDDLTQSTPEGTAKALFQQWRTTAFGSHATTLSDYTSEKVDLDGQSVTLVHGAVHYAVKGVASAYDRVVVVVLPVRGGGYTAYVSSRPDDTPKGTLDALNHSLNSLRYDK